jgi:hypothetical protein
MRHERHYSVQEANALREWVAARVLRIRRALDRLHAERARDALALAAAEQGGGSPGREVASDVLHLHVIARELQAADVVVRDLRTGLVDFPAVREGREVYLCWMAGEPEVAHWHELDAGAAGRRPL